MIKPTNPNPNLGVGNTTDVAKVLYQKHHRKEQLQHEKLAEQQADEQLDEYLSANAAADSPHYDDALRNFQQRVTAGKMPTTIRHPLSASALQAKFNARLLDNNELEVLCAYYDGSDLNDEFESLAIEIEASEEGQEVAILNRFFGASDLSPAQKYYLLMLLHPKMANSNKKKKFAKELASYILQFEEQNSGFLFEFFSLIGNDKVTKNFSPAAVDALATIGGGELNMNDLSI